MVRLTRWLALGVLSIPMITLAAADSDGSFVVFDSEFFSEPETLDVTLDDWGAGFTSGERQWAVSSLELGFRHKGLEFSVEQRVLADLRFNTEAAEFYGRIARKEELTAGETVPVHVDVNGFTAQALRLGYRFEADTWFFGVGGDILFARNLMSGDLDGQFSITSAQDYNFDATVDYHYYRDPIFDRPNVKDANGVGWAMRLSGEWRVNDYWLLNAEVDDLFAKIRWEDAPYTDARAHSDRKRYDEEGYAIFDPYLEGVEGYEPHFYQDLDPRFKLRSVFQLGPLTGHIQARYQFDYASMGYGAGYRFGETFSVRALVWPKLDAAGLELDYHKFTFGMSLDSLDGEEIHFVNLSLSYGY